MLSSEWWIYHLTANGWIEGSYKHDFAKEVEIPVPIGTILSRKYEEKLGHAHATMKRRYEDLDVVSEEAIKLLKIFPHPKGLEDF